jgi:NTE family protein
VVNPKSLSRLVARSVLFGDLAEAPVPFLCVATDLLSGRQVELRSGDAVDAVMASCALPGLFPPVTIGGCQLIDGGVANNVPIANAVAAGATRIFVLPAGHACAPRARPAVRSTSCCTPCR